MTVRREARAADDGYSHELVPGLRASDDARRLADELAFSAARLRELQQADPPGLYADVAQSQDKEEATWLAFLIAYFGPLEGEDPWAGIRAARTPWSAGAGLASLDGPTGPRGSFDPGRGPATVAAYRGWAGRAGSQAAGIGGEEDWPPERRFARAFERLALPGLHRGARFDFLATLGACGRFALAPAALGFTAGGADVTLVAAKRAFGIGDPMLLERRAAGLAEASGLPLAALDLALASWESGTRIHGGVPDSATDPAAATLARDALGI
jgi:hypothetical protein